MIRFDAFACDFFIADNNSIVIETNHPLSHRIFDKQHCHATHIDKLTTTITANHIDDRLIQDTHA